MATVLASNIATLDRDLPKGSTRLVVTTRVSPAADPTKIEDIIGTNSADAATFMKLRTGWRDVGRTGDGGFTFGQSWDTTEGTATDQDDENIGGGEPTGFTRTGNVDVFEVTDANLRDYFLLGAPTAIAAAGSGGAANVAQKAYDIKGLDDRIEQKLVLLQMNPKTKVLEAWYLERALMTELGDIQRNKNLNATTVTYTFYKNLTTNVYGKYFRTDAAIPGA